MSIAYKICLRCGKKKDSDSFYQYRKGDKVYIRNVCRQCWHKQIVECRREHKFLNPKGMYNLLKSTSNKQNVNLSITLNEFIKWWNGQEMKCFYCKRTLQEITHDDDKINKKSNRLTVDRIDNKEGYTIGNIVLCCLRCNYIKGDFFNKGEMLKIGKIMQDKFKIKMVKPESNIDAHSKSRADIVGKRLTENDKKVIDQAVKKIIREYGDVLQLLGRK
ncbi:MAG: hypothetical protein ISS45_13205 [Candidatus Omnitrophica bacterium]|nr:hypothetical protein [Candidatus Omnitrophota bacterium]